MAAPTMFDNPNAVASDAKMVLASCKEFDEAAGTASNLLHLSSTDGSMFCCVVQLRSQYLGNGWAPLLIRWN